MKKEIINLKVYISLLSILYVGFFAYIIITKTTLAPEYILILPPVILNIITNIIIFANEDAGIKIVPALAAFTLMMGAISINVICLVGAIVLFVSWFKYYKIVSPGGNIQYIMVSLNQYGKENYLFDVDLKAICEFTNLYESLLK